MISAKFFIYLVVTPLVIYGLDSVNINKIFKKNKILQARIFYLLLALSLIYIITSFTFDFFTSSQIL